MENQVSLEQVLANRDRRAEIQKSLLQTYKMPVLSFSMNIAGPVKTGRNIIKAFDIGVRNLKKEFVLADPVFINEITGPELICCIDRKAEQIKKICIGIEEENTLGRLFDLDVTDTDGTKLERPSQRSCIVCGKPGRECASRRLHSLEELKEATQKILSRGIVAEYAVQALQDEVLTTPKPGLVDRNNSGSHKDMTLETFEKSIRALRPYWAGCFDIGTHGADFTILRKAGKKAEKLMYGATGNINTHKGAVFLLGTLCCAAGAIWPETDPKALADKAAQISAKTIEEDFRAIREKSEPETKGEKLYRKYGLEGIRGELRDGLPSVLNTALPVYEKTLSGEITLLHLIALGKDTNMIARGGIEKAEKAVQKTRELLRSGSETGITTEKILQLDRYFIENNLSPGGCADLLAITYFLHSLNA